MWGNTRSYDPEEWLIGRERHASTSHPNFSHKFHRTAEEENKCVFRCRCRTKSLLEKEHKAECYNYRANVRNGTGNTAFSRLLAFWECKREPTIDTKNIFISIHTYRFVYIFAFVALIVASRGGVFLSDGFRVYTLRSHSNFIFLFSLFLWFIRKIGKKKQRRKQDKNKS